MSIQIIQKRPRLFSRDLYIVCNFLSSSAGFNLCSCFFPAHPRLPLSFPTFLGRPFRGSSPLPFRFLTPAVSASFRPLLFRFRLLSHCFFLSSFFPAPPHSGCPGVPLPLSLRWLSPFSPTRFPVSSFPVLRTRLPVCFLSSFPVSLPQLFHRCFPFGLSPHFRLLSSASVWF